MALAPIEIKMQKHPTIGLKENLSYTSEMLKSEWTIISGRFKLLIEGKRATEKVMELIEYIENSKYSTELYPGSSLGRLLISKPEGGKLNYQRTLSIDTSPFRKRILLEYSDWDTVQDRSENPVLWRVECEPENLIDTFEGFIKWNKNWR